MNLKPLFDNVIIRPIEEDDVTPSGILLPDTAKEKPQKGEVIAVGSGKINEKGDRIAVDVKAGDKVLYKKYGLSEFKYEGEELLIGEQADLLAVIQ